MKVVADTNVLVSGLIWRGPPASVLDLGTSRLFSLVTSEEMLAELENVLSRRHLAARLRVRGQTVAGVMLTYRGVAEIIKPAELARPAALRDAKDLAVLRCALAGDVDAIVTGDDDLLVLKDFRDIPILTPRQFLTSIGM